MSESATLTVLCMVYDGDKILMQDRLKADWRGWTFPGGHVEKGESFVGAVIREIKEETGLTISNPRLCGLKQFALENGERYVVILFKTAEFSGELCSSEEGEMTWVHRDDLKNWTLASGFFDTLELFDNADVAELFLRRMKRASGRMSFFDTVGSVILSAAKNLGCGFAVLR